jgi:hypothetical protein
MERHQEFDYFIEECHRNVTIAGIIFSPADILAECDPIAYRVMLNDWQSTQCEDGLHSHEIADSVCDFCGEDVTKEEEN